MNTEAKTIDLLSLITKETNDVVVPAGVTAAYDSANGPCKTKAI